MPHKPHLRYVFVYAFVFLIIWLFVLPLSFRNKFQHLAFSLQAPLWKASALLNDLQKFSFAHAQSKAELIKQVQTLAQENAYLKQQIADQKEMVSMSQRILGLNKLDVGEHFKCVVAKVIYRSNEVWEQSLIIDKGKRDGLCVGQGVLCTKGIVGRIHSVTNETACVELASNPDFQLLVTLNNDKQPHKLQGCFNAKSWRKPWKAKITDLSEVEEKESPCIIETTALGQQFPDHIYVGQCTKIKKDQATFVGTVYLGEYLKWIDEVGVLVPILTL